MCDEEQLEPTFSSTRLYLGGGFKDETKRVTAGTMTDGAALESTQQEAENGVSYVSVYAYSLCVRVWTRMRMRLRVGVRAGVRRCLTN